MPASGFSSPAMMRSSVDLPPPLGPSKCGERAARDLERDVVERDELAEPLDDAAHADGHRLAALLRPEHVDHDQRAGSR